MQLRDLTIVRSTVVSLGALAVLVGFGLTAPVQATTLCPSQATPGGFGGTSTNVSGPLDGTCGTNSAVKIDIPASTDYGKLEFQSTMPGFPTGLTLGGLGGASANVAFSSGGTDQPYFLLAFTDGSNSLGQSDATDQILLIEFQSSALSGNTLALDPNSTLFNVYDNTTGAYLQGGQHVTNTLDGWLSTFGSLSAEQLDGIWIGEGLTGSNTGAESLTVNSLSITPVPGALPLFATCIAGLVLLGWRGKRKAPTLAA